MQVILNIPDNLSEKINAYLQTNSEDSLILLIEDAIELRTFPKNPEALLKLAGIVESASFHADENAEDKCP